MRPWNYIEIDECNESLLSIPLSFYRITPHPYLSLGAPYGQSTDPWRLRVDVIRRLTVAQELLLEANHKVKLALFDAWRPIAVQQFMVDYVIQKQCQLKGINPLDVDYELHRRSIAEEVSNFWALPSLNPSTPPPHSTGAAVDLTLVDDTETLVDMGGEIDAIGPISSPDYYNHLNSSNPSSISTLYHSRRQLLSDVMERAGFAQHPHEWWHFSFGDQMWAWKRDYPRAIYGAFADFSKPIIKSSPNCLT